MDTEGGGHSLITAKGETDVRQDGIELFDERSSTKVFYKTLNRESSGEEPENVQDDSELGATSATRADQEIVDVILSGKVSTASVVCPRFSSLTSHS